VLKTEYLGTEKYTDRTDMDPLTPVFAQFTPSAQVFFTGNLCQSSTFDVVEGVGHLHVLRSGQLILQGPNGTETVIDQPCALLYPRPAKHSLRAIDSIGANLVCASLELGSGSSNPMVSALPEMVHVSFDQAPMLDSTLALLFDEFEAENSGKRAALDCLTQYLLIQLLRHIIESGLFKGGALAGLHDTRLQPALCAIHEQPELPWTLEELAALSNLSRTRFAERFKNTVGTTPLEYLTDWRMSIARTLLRKGQRISRIAEHVGYPNQSSFSRVFTRRIGASPRRWLAAQKV